MSGRSQHSQPNVSRLIRRARGAHEAGDFATAERLYSAVLQRQAKNFDALHGLGRLHCQRGRFDTALPLIQAALRSDGSRAEGFADLGLAFHCLRRFEAALISYDQGLALDPGNAELRNRRGVALLELCRPAEALDNFAKTLAADPFHLDALGNYGNALLKLNRPQEALAAYDRALTHAPDSAPLLTNRAVALRRLDRPHEALMSTSRALAADPDFVQGRFVDAVARLTLGDFAAGWRGYEARWAVGLLARQRRNFTAPLWLGQETPQVPLDGKTILLYAEQGFGDAIQFLRYVPLVAARGAKTIIVEVRRDLVPLVSDLPGVTAVIAYGDPLPQFDMHCPLMSLPFAFATELVTIPAAIPYLAARQDRIALWRDRPPQTRPLIGLAWSGERSHDNDLNRSIALETLLPLFDLPDMTFVSLQHDVRERDLAVLQRLPKLARIEPKFADFADTAAVISLVDAVVSADTAVAHLAGALGKPLLLLLPFAADFRWLRERTDSPWYPTARLYRQPRFGDWESVIATLAQDLARADFAATALKLSA